MQRPTAATLLNLWEAFESQSLAAWALQVLAAAWPDVSAEHLAQLTIGQRNRRFFELYPLLFGNQLDGVPTCPNCQTQIEFTLQVSQLLLPEPASPTIDFVAGEITLNVRLPNSTDLLAIGGLSDPSESRMHILRRCILDGASHSVEALPSPVLESLEAAMSEADPQADMQFSLSCPDCNHQWSHSFDIVRYFGRKLTIWSQQLFTDIDLLARTYGWREADILTMSVRRRQRYIDLITG